MKARLVRVFGTIVIAFVLVPSLSYAQSKPINLALFDPIQIYPESTPISGLSINLIYGKNVSVTGLDWGLVNAVGNEGFKGVQWGIANFADGNSIGMQGGIVNLAQHDIQGFQYGWVNWATHVSGFQLGLVNYAGTMNGLQIGIINIIKTRGQFPVFPIVNWSF